MVETTSIDITQMRNSTVQYLFTRRSEIDMDPPYQRQGSVWSQQKQQLLIDSLLNEFDVPKIYLHQFSNPEMRDGTLKRWALVDGKQRLEAIFGFLENSFPLGDDFVFIATGDIGAAGKTYFELTESHPFLVSTLNATSLDVITMRTDDIELIEEMFSRLNEAVPLNAAEKRNSIGGPLPKIVRELVEETFFKNKLPFTNRRYRHFDLAAKFLYWTDNRLEGAKMEGGGAIRDTKKVRLDTFFRDFNKIKIMSKRCKDMRQGVESNLRTLEKTFVDQDPLLNSVGMISIYFLLAERRAADKRSFPSRSQLLKFENARRVRRVKSDDELTPGEYEMLEFGRLSQSPNDGSALTYRLTLIDIWLTADKEGGDPMKAIATGLANINT